MPKKDEKPPVHPIIDEGDAPGASPIKPGILYKSLTELRGFRMSPTGTAIDGGALASSEEQSESESLPPVKTDPEEAARIRRMLASLDGPRDRFVVTDRDRSVETPHIPISPEVRRLIEEEEAEAALRQEVASNSSDVSLAPPVAPTPRQEPERREESRRDILSFEALPGARHVRPRAVVALLATACIALGALAITALFVGQASVPASSTASTAPALVRVVSALPSSTSPVAVASTTTALPMAPVPSPPPPPILHAIPQDRVAAPPSTAPVPPSRQADDNTARTPARHRDPEPAAIPSRAPSAPSKPAAPNLHDIAPFTPKPSDPSE